ncbi:ribonuclease HII [Ostreococcus tauri]|uniref:Ribonuclease n=1 Tax=Ostreococcus tauri TaxID=70448 RepID=A0A1Y5I8M2_OSTTA|nr:ribonuclease HII [Ostreococcus tauri]
MATAQILIAGVDEAGRGPWAGPVTAGAVILDPARPIDGLTDSKKLTEAKRDALAPMIRDRAAAWSVAHATPEEIDRLNIRQATFLAMDRAVTGLGLAPGTYWWMATPCPPAFPIVKGDLTEPAISAASILAKTVRDALMKEMDLAFPAYGFARHKGYGTAAHAAALMTHGPCAHHRKSFAPVKRALATNA